MTNTDFWEAQIAVSTNAMLHAAEANNVHAVRANAICLFEAAAKLCFALESDIAKRTPKSNAS